MEIEMDAFHRLAHLFGTNTGRVYSWMDSDTGHMMIGFRCDRCGTIEGVRAANMGVDFALPGADHTITYAHGERHE